jgi:hypothetical protein
MLRQHINLRMPVAAKDGHALPGRNVDARLSVDWASIPARQQLQPGQEQLNRLLANIVTDTAATASILFGFPMVESSQCRKDAVAAKTLLLGRAD